MAELKNNTPEQEKNMKLKTLPYDLTVCKLPPETKADLSADFFCLMKTDEEISLVCRTEQTPAEAAVREDGWRAFRIEGVLDFSLTGILSGLSGILAENGIGIFAVSTYNTDYILVKAENLGKALDVLREAGYETDNG